MRFLRNAITAARDPAIGVEYARWRIGSALGRPPLVDNLFDTRLAASTFAEFRATRGFVPSAPEAEMIRRVAAGHPVFFDIGANVGVWTVALAAAHPKAHVYSFEPAPATFRTLCKNVALNRLANVSAAQVAVSDATGVLAFQITRNRSFFNRLAPRKATAEELGRGRFTEAHTVDVKSIRLDEFCESQGISRIGFLKIDCEGAEPSILKGAERLLRRRAIDLIWMEVDPENLREMGDSLDTLDALMKEIGYTIHLLRPDGLPGPPVDVRRQTSDHMVAIPASK